MKKNVIVRVAAIVVMCALVTACFASSTFAKYTSSINLAESSATVASWKFKVNGNEITASPTPSVTFDLFGTIKDTAGADEGDVAADKIAPGTSGSFTITVENPSDVTAQYAIDFTVTNDNSIPIQYSVDGGKTWKDSLDDITASDSTKLASGSAAKTAVKVDWKWAFEDGKDTADTTLGITGTAKVAVKATITATQVD